MVVFNPEPHRRPMASAPSGPSNPVNSRSNRTDITIFVERIPNRPSSSGTPTTNPPNTLPPISNPEARPKKKQWVRVDLTHDHPAPTVGHLLAMNLLWPMKMTQLRTGHGLPVHRSAASAPAPATHTAAPAVNTGLRPWPEADDNELIGYKLDTRSADSCKARWQWLKNTRPDLVTRTRTKKTLACFSSFNYSPFPSWLRVTCSLLRPYFRFGLCWLLGAPSIPLPMMISLAYLPSDWDSTPTVRRLRRVLILVDLQEVRHVTEDVCHTDALPATRCNSLPCLTRITEESALFTYPRLLQTSRLMVITPGILLSGISEYIRKTWEIQLDPDELDLRWNDSSGDTCVLSNNINIIQLLTMYRPSWCREQDIGTLLPPRPFTDFTQPYIMRLSCHRDLREGHLA